MNSRVRKALQFILFFGLGLGLLWWQFSRFTEQQRDEFFFAISNAKYGWMVVAVIIGALAHLSRAIRWQQLLTPLGHNVGLGSRFYAVMIGYLANYGIPRSGEVIRCGILKTSDEVPFSESFGTVVVERIVDSLCLGVVFILILVSQFSELGQLWSEKIWIPASNKIAAFGANTTAMAMLIGGIIFIVVLFYTFRKKVQSMIRGRLASFLTGFRDGFLAVRRVPRPGWFIFHSLFIWSCYLFSLYSCLFCFTVTSSVSLNSALILLLFGTFGVAFTPGGIGAYQVFVTSVLAYLLIHNYGFNGTQNEVEPLVAPFAWLSWGAQVVTVILFTGISIAVRSTLNRETT
ncbi:MAG TPA: lysylphosphatidylglycerol synthase transmembrane domain-containing protein [Bacteroidia bacterium]|nr:lysylphosphatidylglycerol synthase transmembrane domain-containing protein [Bacteroidia bacterium]